MLFVARWWLPKLYRDSFWITQVNCWEDALEILDPVQGRISFSLCKKDVVYFENGSLIYSVINKHSNVAMKMEAV